MQLLLRRIESLPKTQYADDYRLEDTPDDTHRTALEASRPFFASIHAVDTGASLFRGKSLAAN